MADTCHEESAVVELLALCERMQALPSGKRGKPDKSWPEQEPRGGVIFTECDDG